MSGIEIIIGVCVIITIITISIVDAIKLHRKQIETKKRLELERKFLNRSFISDLS